MAEKKKKKKRRRKKKEVNVGVFPLENNCSCSHIVDQISAYSEVDKNASGNYVRYRSRGDNSILCLLQWLHPE